MTFAFLFGKYPDLVQYFLKFLNENCSKKWGEEKSDEAEQKESEQVTDLRKTMGDYQRFYAEKYCDGDSTFRMEIEHDQMLKETKETFTNFKNKIAGYSFNIKYKEQMGQDAGGLRREFFFLIFEQLFSDHTKYFTLSGENSKYLFPSVDYPKEDAYDAFFFIGQFIAQGLKEKSQLTGNLSRILTKMLTCKPLIFDDLKYYDIGLYEQLKQLLQYPNVEDFNLFFEYDRHVQGRVEQIELVENGHSI